MNDVEGDSVSSKMARFDKPYISFYDWSVVIGYITTFYSVLVRYVTARDLEKSFSFDATARITGRIRVPIHM